MSTITNHTVSLTAKLIAVNIVAGFLFAASLSGGSGGFLFGLLILIAGMAASIHLLLSEIVVMMAELIEPAG